MIAYDDANANDELGTPNVYIGSDELSRKQTIHARHAAAVHARENNVIFYLPNLQSKVGFMRKFDEIYSSLSLALVCFAYFFSHIANLSEFLFHRPLYCK